MVTSLPTRACPAIVLADGGVVFGLADQPCGGQLCWLY
jgi:hypothetical protein